MTKTRIDMLQKLVSRTSYLVLRSPLSGRGLRWHQCDTGYVLFWLTSKLSVSVLKTCKDAVHANRGRAERMPPSMEPLSNHPASPTETPPAGLGNVD